jgi:hypothetical protein
MEIANKIGLAFYVIIILFVSNSCVVKDKGLFVDNIKYRSVKDYGAAGNGIDDDVRSIQRAFDMEENIFFPKGSYLIRSSFGGTHNPQSLLITNKSKVRAIEFEEGAQLYIGEDFVFEGIKSSVIKIYTESGNIKNLKINGLKIYSKDILYTRSHTGVFAIENNGYEIQNLEINKASFYNLSGAGIITYALKTTLNNIYTENTTSHGIGALNPYNKGKEHYLYIDGYNSVNDKAYSIDFSGTEHANNSKEADPKDTWTGVAKNITSTNSKRGIKTAGHWNLYLENVTVKNPSIYGFFINKDAPGRKIVFKNVIIENAGDAGLSLAGKTGFEGENLTLLNCKMGAQFQNVDANIKNLLIDGKGQSKMGLRFQGSGIISDFVVTGIEDEYAVWVTAKEATLQNGRIYNNNSTCGLLIHEAPENTIIDNVKIYDDRANPIQVKDIMVIQKGGKLKIIEPKTDLRSYGKNKLKIENRSGIKIEKSY